ncbi:Cu-Zn family superoxide dismutase [Kineococcus xinjiangensis]|uniref:Cu-Zn family superoxide dismutase n=1 Tax=Kineococcus xinjiangensis TaxID=512762 RepID=A0A2S6IPD1_9ACTN|nr:superoxide dismutase [Kineococcus xinjiangensis]PPK96112.1 Cu-Zn family superoxide dismutase [Kineococcus xinjiangensis]
MRTPHTAAVTAVAALAVTVLGTAPASADVGDGQVVVLHAAGSFDPSGTGGAWTYDPALVPAGARARVVSVSVAPAERTRTRLSVRGLLPDRAYGAHLHVSPCGALPAASGPHYQQVPDPAVPSVDPAYANPVNEVWLDLHTDARGRAVVRASNPWSYREVPASLVLHAQHTHTEPGRAGTAGARLACIDLR